MVGRVINCPSQTALVLKDFSVRKELTGRSVKHCVRRQAVNSLKLQLLRRSYVTAFWFSHRCKICPAVIPKRNAMVFIAIIAVTLRRCGSSFADLLRISFGKHRKTRLRSVIYRIGMITLCHHVPSWYSYHLHCAMIFKMIRDRSLFITRVGAEEKVFCSFKKNFTPPIVRIKFFLPYHERRKKLVIKGAINSFDARSGAMSF